MNGRFFDTYSMDSIERFYINEMASYFETLGMLRSKEIVDAELALDWSGALTAWRVVGPVLMEARGFSGIPSLWIEFENLAQDQVEYSAQRPGPGGPTCTLYNWRLRTIVQTPM
jgi:hypothetical protein